MSGQQRPKVAVIDPNTLAAIGLKQLLQSVTPIMVVDTFGSFAELEANHPESYVHFFVAMNIVLENRLFFSDHRHKTIVLSLSLTNTSQLNEFRSLCINVPEPELVRALLILQQHAHSGGRNLPPMPQALQQKILSDREIEVMSLIVQGHINKEIADTLCISTNTVSTHRKNISAKLGIHGVSGLSLYAVMNGII